MNNASTVAATTASSHTILTTLSPVFTYLIYIPTKFIILTAIPIIFQYAYLAITYTLHYLAVMLRIALIPVLYPLDLFLWRPCMAVILLFYQYRYLIYFTSSAIILGGLFGLASFWLSSRLVRSTTYSKVIAGSAVPQSTSSTSSSKRESAKLLSQSTASPPLASLSLRRSALPSKQRPESSLTNNESRPKEGSSFNNIKARSTSKMKREIPTPSIFVFEEEAILVKSPESELGPTSPSKIKEMTSSLHLNNDDNADVESRDRFEQAMKALARQRKQSKLG